MTDMTRPKFYDEEGTEKQVIGKDADGNVEDITIEKITAKTLEAEQVTIKTDITLETNAEVKGNIKGTTNITANEKITGKNIEATETVKGKNATISEKITSKNIENSATTTTQDIVINNSLNLNQGKFKVDDQGNVTIKQNNNMALSFLTQSSSYNSGFLSDLIGNSACYPILVVLSVKVVLSGITGYAHLPFIGLSTDKVTPISGQEWSFIFADKVTSSPTLRKGILSVTQRGQVHYEGEDYFVKENTAWGSDSDVKGSSLSYFPLCK